MARGKNGTIWFGAYKALVGYNSKHFKILNDDFFGYPKKKGGLHIRGFIEDRERKSLDGE
ncbi:MAG: hypothetical protein U0V75_10185 [Ferruginibacter sp.]